MTVINKIKAVLAVFAISGLLLGFSGCAKRTVAPESDPLDIPGYTQLRKELGPLDFSPLVGRTIVLDPGHGGYFRGAVGPGGLTEAEVNLGVALYLRGLLEWAGATVHLTRSADYDFLSPADSSLSSDLAFRANFSNQLQPDVFISIHHNSTASADPAINETQTYYPIGQEGASLDLARSIHRHLVMNLEIKPAKILPGNFHVLRKATVPAVLGEPAMISNPVIEGRLNLAASHDLEARAYFLGLLDYFAGGSPRWSGAALDTVYYSPNGSRPTLNWAFQPGDTPQAPGPDISTYRLTQNGQDTPFDLSPDGFTLSWQAGSHGTAKSTLLAVVGKNLQGRSTPLRQTLLLPMEPAAQQVHVSRETGPSGGYDLVHWQDDGPSGPGQGWALTPTPATAAPQETLNFLEATLAVQWDTPTIEISDLPEGQQWRLVSITGQDPSLVREVPPGGWHRRLAATAESAGSSPSGILSSQGPAMPVIQGQRIWLEAAGVRPLISLPQGAGSSPGNLNFHDRFWISEILIPALYGATIVLDPAGGGTNADGTGPLGTRGADINLKTALAARRLLEGAGAQVHLTREGEYAPPNQDKARLADRVGADLFMTIGRSQQPGLMDVRHHPGSQKGIAWATAQAWAASSLQPADSSLQGAVSQSWAYLLRHTACPAIEAFFPPLSSVARELQADSSAWAQSEARSILLGCAVAMGQTEFMHDQDPTEGLDIAAPLTILHPEIIWEQLPAATRLDHMEWALLDGNFPWLPSGTWPATGDSLSFSHNTNKGISLGPGLPALPGQHTLEIHQGRNWQLWLLNGIGKNRENLESELLLEGP